MADEPAGIIRVAAVAALLYDSKQLQCYDDLDYTWLLFMISSTTASSSEPWREAQTAGGERTFRQTEQRGTRGKSRLPPLITRSPTDDTTAAVADLDIHHTHTIPLHTCARALPPSRPHHPNGPRYYSQPNCTSSSSLHLRWNSTSGNVGRRTHLTPCR
jgi:hypothetical protein